MSSTSTKLLIVTMIVLAFLRAALVQSVVMQSKFASSGPHIYPDGNKLGDDPDIHPPSYALTIYEGESIEVGLESESEITVQLNRLVPHDVNVTVSVFSRPDLISFGSNNSKTTSINITFEAGTFGERMVKFNTTKRPGHAEIICKVTSKFSDIHIDDTEAYISINISRSPILGWIISVVGWMYFIAWSLSFYFQVILNHQRKSVVGLNFDFLALNLLGFTCYSIYNLTLKFSRQVQKDYFERYTYSRIPVEYNDIFFAIHAFILTLITIAQCFVYERGQQKVSILSGAFIALTSLAGFSLFITHLFNELPVLDVVIYLSYVKLAVTLIKYTPQAYMNYKRQATTGWSIHNILLDFTGGVLSIAQMFLIAINYDDWIAIFGNFTKFGLGVFSITFDILFVIQHYVLYNQPALTDERLSDSNESIPSPVISQSLRASNYGADQTSGRDNSVNPSENSDDEERTSEK